MKNNWIELYQNSVLDTYKIKVNSLYVMKELFGVQLIITEINDSDVSLRTRSGKIITRNIRWCVDNLKEVMRIREEDGLL